MNSDIREVLFMLSKHPASDPVGDVVMSRLMVTLAAESFKVSCVALSNKAEGPSTGVPLFPVVKSDGWVKHLAVLRSFVGSRSAIHSRFNQKNLREFLAESSYDRYVAEHSYMAEAYLSVRKEHAKSELIVNTHVSESHVLRGVHPIIGRVESIKTERDQFRVAALAHKVGCFDSSERDEYTRRSETPATWLDLTFPSSGTAPDRGTTPPRIAFVGDLSWQPNRQSLKPLLAAWPTIRRGNPRAELLLIGRGTEALTMALPEGVLAMGFVADLRAALDTCRALIAPITVGGGVRVKILEAAAMGLPVIGSKAAIGSLSAILPVTTSQTVEDLVERALMLLGSPGQSGAEGKDLYEANEARWTARLPHERVQAFIG